MSPPVLFIRDCWSKVLKLTSNSGPDGPFPSHKEGGDWEHHHGSGSASSTSNSTKIKEREELHEYVYLLQSPMKTSSSCQTGGQAPCPSSLNTNIMMALGPGLRAPIAPRLRNVRNMDHHQEPNSCYRRA